VLDGQCAVIFAVINSVGAWSKNPSRETTGYKSQLYTPIFMMQTRYKLTVVEICYAGGTNKCCNWQERPLYCHKDYAYRDPALGRRCEKQSHQFINQWRPSRKCPRHEKTRKLNMQMGSHFWLSVATSFNSHAKYHDGCV